MPSIPLADIETIRPHVEFLADRGVSCRKYLEAAHIHPGMVEDGEGRVSKAQIYTFLKHCARGDGGPDLGYRVGEANGIDALGRIAPAIRTATTLNEAVEIFDGLVRGWMGGNRIWLERDGDQVWFKNVTSDTTFQGDRDLSNQTGVMEFIDLIRLAGGAEWKPRQVVIEMRPNRVHERVEALAEAEVRFDPMLNAVAFSLECLARPLNSLARPDVAPDLPPEPTSFAESLSVVIRDRFGHAGYTDLATAAEIAGMSPRTVQRWLGREGLSFQRLVDRVRFGLATEMLDDPNVTALDVAETLGYFGRNNFLRAFRRFAGMTPTEYRRFRLEDES